MNKLSRVLDLKKKNFWFLVIIFRHQARGSLCFKKGRKTISENIIGRCLF